MRGTLRRRGNSWTLQVYAGLDPATGKERRVTRTFHAPEGRAGRKAAERALAELVVEVEAGLELRHRDLTFGQLLDRWVAARAVDWSPKTLRERRATIRLYLAPDLGDTPAHRVRGADLDALYARLLARGLSPATARKVHATAHTALGQGVKWGVVATNAADAATQPKARRAQISPPSPEDLGRALRAVEGDPAFAALLRLAASTGARRGQLVALQWDDIDLEAGVVEFSRALAKGPNGWVVKGLKSDRPYRAAISADVVTALRRHRRIARERALAARCRLSGDAWVFSSELDGSEPWKPDSITQRWGRVRRRLDLGDVRFHDLRHFVATQLLAAGVDPRTVAGRLGHANPNVTLAVYAHFVPERDREAAEVMEGLLAGDG